MIRFILTLFACLSLAACDRDPPGSHWRVIPINSHATVVDRIYQPDTRSGHLAPGYSFGHHGGVTLSYVSTGSPEKYILIVKQDNGKVFSREVDAGTYANSKVGSTISWYESAVHQLVDDHGDVYRQWSSRGHEDDN